jgi:hypothetical protein
MSLTGSITGRVLPVQAAALVTATSNADTVATYADATGSFRLVGLPPTTYNVHIEATQGSYRDTTIANVDVLVGQTTSVGTIVLELLLRSSF